MDFVLPATNDSVDLLAVFEEEKGRHCLDLVFFSSLLLKKETALVSPQG
jgi:hypothetical protein